MPRFPARKIIFDLDGTLVESAPDLWQATNHVLAHVGRDPVTLEQVRHMVGFGALRLMELGLNATGGVGDHDVKSLLPVFLDYYSAHIADHTVFFPGVREMVAELKAGGCAVAVCTNKPVGLANQLLAALDARDLFGAVTGGDSFAFKKPDGRHIHETAALLPDDGAILMVGDSATDVNAAKDAGVPCVAVSFGYSTVPAADLGADALIHDLADLRPLILG
ncbi:MAG: HAD family hydrolase [Alphaproteobacteria bacterium]|nr:MAG: HAD family hydrolase [Alphaproteobacteria bacterium]